MTIKAKFVFRLSQIQRRPYCYTHSNQTLYNITNKIYHNPGPFLAPFYVTQTNPKTECLSPKAVPRPGAGRFFQGVSQKFFGPSGREAIFPGPIRKFFLRFSGEGDFSRRLPVPFRFFQVRAYPVFSGYLQNFLAYFWRVRFFQAGRYPSKFFWRSRRGRFFWFPFFLPSLPSFSQLSPKFFPTLFENVLDFPRIDFPFVMVQIIVFGLFVRFRSVLSSVDVDNSTRKSLASGKDFPRASPDDLPVIY